MLATTAYGIALLRLDINRYCSKECQKKDFGTHKITCKKLDKTAKDAKEEHKTGSAAKSPPYATTSTTRKAFLTSPYKQMAGIIGGRYKGQMCVLGEYNRATDMYAVNIFGVLREVSVKDLCFDNVFVDTLFRGGDHMIKQHRTNAMQMDMRQRMGMPTGEDDYYLPEGHFDLETMRMQANIRLTWACM